MLVRSFLAVAMVAVGHLAYAGKSEVEADIAKGDAAAQRRDMPEAIKWFSRAIEKDPLNVDALTSRAVMCAHSGHVDLALQDATRALQLNPKSTDAYFARAMAFRHRGEIDKAIADLSEAIRLNPRRWNLFSMRGEDYARQHRLKEALADYDRAIELDPNKAINFVSRAEVRISLGKYAAALKDFERAQKLEPELPATYDAFSRLLATCPDRELRDGKRALEYAKIAMELNPNREEQWETYATASAAVGDFEQAIEWQQRFAYFKGLSEAQRSEAERRLALYKKGQFSFDK